MFKIIAQLFRTLYCEVMVLIWCLLTFRKIACHLLIYRFDEKSWILDVNHGVIVLGVYGVNENKMLIRKIGRSCIQLHSNYSVCTCRTSLLKFASGFLLFDFELMDMCKQFYIFLCSLRCLYYTFY